MKWTTEELIKALQKLTKELGKPPSAVECNNCSYTANSSTYTSRFGSWNKAKEAAGLKISTKFDKVSNENLIKSLQDFYKENRRAPKQKECRRENGLYGPNTYKDRFGGWKEALKVAGLEENKYRSTQISDEELIESLQKFYNINGRTPKHEDCNSSKELKAHIIYSRRFGSFTNALKKAGIPLLKTNPEIAHLSDNDLLGTIRRFYKEYNRAPTQEDCVKSSYLKSHATYNNRFGGFLKAIELAKVPLNNKSSSVKEIELFDYISSIYFKEIKRNHRLLKNKEVDIYLPEEKLAIEFNGLYWHSQSVKTNKNYHLNKTREAESLGIRLIHIFENEWINKQEIVKSRIKNLLGLNKTIYARKCTIKEISSEDCRDFLNKNHIQGAVNSSVRLGLFYLDELVAVQSFSKSRFKAKAEWELIRYCNKLNISVVGGASKLFKYFIKNYDPKSVVSYSDKRWNTGNLYKQLKFSFSHSSNPNYWYFKGLNLESRMKYQKHKLKDKLKIFDQNKTEYENMLDNGYKRIFDCGNDVYLWTQ